MKKQILGAAGILTAGLIAGSAFSITAAANAADRPDVFSPNSVRPGESLVTGDNATKLTDAALAKFPGATVIRVENDSDGDKYEVHLKKADGSVVTVTFDENFTITGDHEGFADASQGGPQGPHADDQGEDQNDD